MKKIVLVGLVNDTNIGDKVIYDNTKYLVEKALKELDITDSIIESIDMTGPISSSNNNSSKREINKLCRNMINKIITPNLKSKIRYTLSKNKTSKDDDKLLKYYEENLKDASMVIFVGGGIIKYLYQDFYRYISLIIDICNKYKIDVIFNSVGVEGYSKKDYRCKKIKTALNSDCIKMITTRDDIEFLENNYIENKNIVVDKVADPAVWSYKTYSNDIKQNKKEVIGLGIIRPGIFLDNGFKFSEKQQLKFWSEIVEKLEEKGYDWELFTNGVKADYDFGKKILDYMKIEDASKLVDIPKNGEELINIIYQYKGIIAARMHANIISYSLDVPSVGIVWNNKLKMFGENIGVPERFITQENFKANYVVQKLEQALEEGYKYNKEEYKETVYGLLKDTIKKYI